MTTQSGKNILVALRRETSIGVQATATGASVLRILPSPGLHMGRGVVQSKEVTDSGVQSMGRLGNKSVDGSYNAELTVGGAMDVLWEALMRGTWSASTPIGFATMTTVAMGTNYLSAAGGDFINTQGLRVGDIFRVSGTTVPGNNNTNNIITALSTLTITTTPGAFTTLAATATGTITRLGKVINPTTPTRLSHTVEEYSQDIDLSELFLGVRVVGAKLSFKPDSMATVQFTFMGLQRTALTTGTSPYFTSPTVTTGLSLVADDSAIYYNGALVTQLTGFDIDFAIDAKTESVIGSQVSPDVYDNLLGVGGTITGLRSDFSNLTLYDAETEFSVVIKLQEPTGTPPACLGIFLPRVKLADVSKDLGSDGAMTETLKIIGGAKVAASGYDATIASFSSSAQ